MHIDINSDFFLVKEIACDENHIDAIESMLKRLQQRIFFDEYDYFRMKLTLVEAVYNSKTHGNHNGSTKTVIVSCVLLEKRIRFMIKDEGNGYKKCKQVVNDQENGRGLMIIENLSDEFILHETGRVAQIDFNIEYD